MALVKASAKSETDKKEKILTKALLRSADLLEVARKDLSEIIGISEPTLSRMYQGQAFISLNSKEGEVASQLVRIYRSLDSIFGGKPDLCSKWLKSRNSHLGGTPLEMTKKIQGLIHVAGYLDAMRAKV